MVKDKKPTIVFFMETKLRADRMEKGADSAGF